VTRHKNSWQALKILYGAQKGKLFSEEEDRFLVCMTHHLGYGQWDQEVRKAWLFRFDWFIKTRSVQRRVDLLIRLIEKENAEIAEAEAEAARKAKKEAAKKSAAGQKGSQPTAAKRKSDAGAGGSAAKKKR
ncbi:Homeodomain-like protein, partial [Pavlovales sp. CCMP2436]